MYLIVTIDTEEDNWGEYNHSEYSLSNIERIPYLQELFDEFDIKPTYLITYPVATNERYISILKKIMDEGKCEIGAHCHPWNTPPFEEKASKINSMLNNLPAELQYNKIKTLHEVIRVNFGVSPVSFRGGRWGFNRDTALIIQKLGYKVDSSITPFTSWICEYGPDFSDITPRPYRIFLDNIFENSKKGSLIEVPVTIGYLQKNFDFANRTFKIIKKVNNKLRLIGILRKLRILNKIWLSPELSSSSEMINLTKVMIDKKFTFLNMAFHSNSLIEGQNIFAKSKDDVNEIINRIRNFLSFTKKAKIKSIKLSEAFYLVSHEEMMQK
jgi:peptidoglycan/xylan/chitin deacetylase (PgdA/CDA1 family)